MRNHLKFFCLFLSIASCKYEDGPLFSLVSPENRIEGYYNIDFVEENGIDQMPRIDTLNITYFYFGGVADIVGPNYNDFSVRIADTISWISFWFFSGSDTKHLYAENFGCGYPPFTPPPFQPLPGFGGTCAFNSTIAWNITKLTQKKIWLDTDYNGNHYEVHLKQFKSAQ